MSSICRSYTAMHPCLGFFFFFFTPMELFGIYIQVGRSSPSPPIDSHVQHPGKKCAHAPLHTGEGVLPSIGELCHYEHQHFKPEENSREIQTSCSRSLCCMHACVFSSSSDIDIKASALSHNYSTSVIPYMRLSAPEIAGTICMFTCFLQT